MSWTKSQTVIPSGHLEAGRTIFTFARDEKLVRTPATLGPKGRYKVEGVLAAGGMGAILEACDERLANRKVLIKIGLIKEERFFPNGRVTPDIQARVDEARERLVDEFDFLVTLFEDMDRLPVVHRKFEDYSPQLHGPHETGGQQWWWEPEQDWETQLMQSEPYIVMQRIDGAGLEQLSASTRSGTQGLGEVGSPLRARRTARIGRELSTLFAQFHHRRRRTADDGTKYTEYYVYQDLKPDNIIFNPITHSVMMVDFGTAARVLRVGDDSVFMGMCEGTPGYMAPELLTDDEEPSVSEWSDLFTLGATLFHLLANRRPQAGEDLLAATRALRQHEFYAPILLELVEQLVSPDPNVRAEACDSSCNHTNNPPPVYALRTRFGYIQQELS